MAGISRSWRRRFVISATLAFACGGMASELFGQYPTGAPVYYSRPQAFVPHAAQPMPLASPRGYAQSSAPTTRVTASGLPTPFQEHSTTWMPAGYSQAQPPSAMHSHAAYQSLPQTWTAANHTYAPPAYAAQQRGWMPAAHEHRVAPPAPPAEAPTSAETKTSEIPVFTESPPSSPPLYNEGFVSSPPAYPYGNGCAPSYGNACCDPCAPPPAEWQHGCDEGPACYALAFGGASYFDHADDTSLGGQYGLSLFLPIYGSVGAMANGAINHYDGGTQYGGTVGLYQGAGLNSFGWNILFDQYTDTGFGSPYAIQGSYSLFYGVAQDLAVGVRYTDPIHGDDIDLDLIVPSASGSAPYSPVEIIEGNLTYGDSIMNYAQVGVGYIDELESMTYRVAFAEPIKSRLSANFNASYDEEIGRWSGFVGVSVDLSSREISRTYVASRSALTGDDVVRGEGSVPMLFDAWAGASGPDPWSPEANPPATLGGGNNLNDNNSRTGSVLSNLTPQQPAHHHHEE